jgi:serine/threonine protein kinase
MYFCPVCRRQFDSLGFCPFDRTELRAITATNEGAKTVVDQASPFVNRVAAPPLDGGRKGTTQGHLPAVTGSVLVPQAPPLRATSQATAESGYMPALQLPDRPPPSQPPSQTPQRKHSPSEMRVLSAAGGGASAALAGLEDNTQYEKMIGQTLDGRYLIEKKIGEGGMGVVFAARHVIIERPLAIKVLRREVMRDAGTIKRFEQEAKAASRIGHPNIVDVTDFGTTPEGMTYSVMEYIKGKTLARVNRKEAPLSLARIFRISSQLARALGAAHDKGIVHRDLKPDNIFLVDRDNREDFVKVVDFGIAKMQPLDGNVGGARLTKIGSVFGTPEYMAPEQAAGRNDTDGRVDIYALGIIMYEMTTGKLPHKGDNTMRTIAMQMLDVPVPPTQLRPDLEIPVEFEAVILRALAKKREQRYQTMGELLAALEVVARQVMGTHNVASLTGAPVPALGLSAIPPGADPSIGYEQITYGESRSSVPSSIPLRARQPSNVPINRSKQPSTAPPSRSKQPTTGYGRNPRAEPEFTASDRPKTFDHVFSDDEVASKRSPWPWIAVAMLVVISGAGVTMLVLNSQRHTSIDARIAEVPKPDAAVVVIVPAPDASEPVDATVDANRIRSNRDSSGPGPLVPIAKPDAAVATPTIVATPNGRGTFEIHVLTRPEGGTLYVGSSYRGPGGVTLEERAGTKATVRCTMPGFKPGTVDLTFDGQTSDVLCVMTRIKICINGIKNPFDDCEVVPLQGSNGAAIP